MREMRDGIRVGPFDGGRIKQFLIPGDSLERALFRLPPKAFVDRRGVPPQHRVKGRLIADQRRLVQHQAQPPIQREVGFHQAAVGDGGVIRIGVFAAQFEGDIARFGRVPVLPPLGAEGAADELAVGVTRPGSRPVRQPWFEQTVGGTDLLVGQGMGIEQLRREVGKGASPVRHFDLVHNRPHRLRCQRRLGEGNLHRNRAPRNQVPTVDDLPVVGVAEDRKPIEGRFRPAIVEQTI